MVPPPPKSLPFSWAKEVPYNQSIYIYILGVIPKKSGEHHSWMWNVMLWEQGSGNNKANDPWAMLQFPWGSRIRTGKKTSCQQPEIIENHLGYPHPFSNFISRSHWTRATIVARGDPLMAYHPSEQKRAPHMVKRPLRFPASNRTKVLDLVRHSIWNQWRVHGRVFDHKSSLSPRKLFDTG